MMAALSYTNRRGDTYYLHAGKTKTGKPRYFVAKKVCEGALASMPDGWEFTESINATVSVRRVKPGAPAVCAPADDLSRHGRVVVANRARPAREGCEEVSRSHWDGPLLRADVSVVGTWACLSRQVCYIYRCAVRVGSTEGGIERQEARRVIRGGLDGVRGSPRGNARRRAGRSPFDSDWSVAEGPRSARRLHRGFGRSRSHHQRETNNVTREEAI